MKRTLPFKLHLLFIYYKSTLLVNLSVAFLFAAMAYSSGFAVQLFAVSFCTAGPVICVLYKEIAAQDQYYFYYNFGMSKTWLISGFMTLNFLSSGLVYLLHFT